MTTETDHHPGNRRPDADRRGETPRHVCRGVGSSQPQRAARDEPDQRDRREPNHEPLPSVDARGALVTQDHDHARGARSSVSASQPRFYGRCGSSHPEHDAPLVLANDRNPRDWPCGASSTVFDRTSLVRTSPHFGRGHPRGVEGDRLHRHQVPVGLVGSESSQSDRGECAHVDGTRVVSVQQGLSSIDPRQGGRPTVLIGATRTCREMRSKTPSNLDDRRVLRRDHHRRHHRCGGGLRGARSTISRTTCDPPPRPGPTSFESESSSIPLLRGRWGSEPRGCRPCRSP